MDLQTRKIAFVQEFLKVQSEEVVIRMEKFLKKEKEKFPESDFQPMSLDELNKRIDRSLLDASNGKITENTDLAKEIQEWSWRFYWTDFSKNELRLIFKYYQERAGSRIARRLVLGITNEVLKLRNQPEIGQREELLIDREQEFRYLICENYKVIYLVNSPENRIEITDVFDTRQNPVKIQRNRGY
jgi:toxin ParE1/3/4